MTIAVPGIQARNRNSDTLADKRIEFRTLPQIFVAVAMVLREGAIGRDEVGNSEKTERLMNRGMENWGTRMRAM